MLPETSCSSRHLSKVHFPVLRGADSSMLSPLLGSSDSSIWIIFSTNHAILSDLLDGLLLGPIIYIFEPFVMWHLSYNG